MQIVTITTDWGTRDHYLASFKGRLFRAMSDTPVQLVDITNSVDPFDILQASFIVKNSYHHFPDGTIHFLGVNGKMTINSLSELLVVESNNQVLVGADTGLFSLILENNPKNIYSIPIPGKHTSAHWDEILLRTIASLASGRKPEDIGKPHESIITYYQPQAVIDNDSIRATVIYIDEFENLILNVKKDVFDQVIGKRSFTISMARSNQVIKKISTMYNDAEEGDVLVRFKRDGYLEIALYRSNAAGLLGMKLFDTVRIEIGE